MLKCSSTEGAILAVYFHQGRCFAELHPGFWSFHRHGWEVQEVIFKTFLLEKLLFVSLDHCSCWRWCHQLSHLWSFNVSPVCWDVSSCSQNSVQKPCSLATSMPCSWEGAQRLFSASPSRSWCWQILHSREVSLCSCLLWNGL